MIERLVIFWLVVLVFMLFGVLVVVVRTPPRPSPIVVIEKEEAGLDRRIEDLEARLFWYQQSQCGSRSEHATEDR